MMFYEGDLQSGINAAVQQSKPVTCFVKDDEAESLIWENDFLKETTLRQLLSEKTLLLRLHAGSKEAGFLAAIYPIPKIPTLVIIHNGQLKECLTSGISKADFLQRVMVALNDRHESPTPMSTEGTSTNVSTNESNRPAPSLTSHNPTPAEHEQSSVVRELLAERSVRMERKKREQDAAEKAERAMKAAARKEALETADPTDSNKTADMKYALLQKNRQQDARNERARILKCVEDDKAERRAKEALRKDRVKVATEFTGSQIPTPTQPVSGNLRGPFKDQECGCALQIRLFDGSTIRSRFSLHNTLQKEVRQWVDAQLADKDIPYTFKQVLTPHPNRTITISEEEDSLQSLGLNPSATLILIPVKDYTSAYESDAPSYISRGISAGAGLVSFGIKMVTGTLGGFLASSTISGLPVDNENHSSSRVSAAANTWTFREQEGGPEEHQLYNGNNKLNFEPRRDDDDKQD